MAESPNHTSPIGTPPGPLYIPESAQTAAPRRVQFSGETRPSLSVTQSTRPQTTDTARRPSRNIDSIVKEDASNERTPLLRPRRSEDALSLSIPPRSGVTSPRSQGSWYDGEDNQESKSTSYLILLTIAIVGLQIAWSVELSNGSPYLLSLGIDKSLLALVWIAGPLSGTLVQPYVGIKSDRCRSRYGKRRPFMIGGAIATTISLVALAWTRELVGGLLGVFGVDRESDTTKYCSIAFAVLMIYVLDFSINVIQAGVRAFIVDNAPTHQQDIANAWAARLSGVGNIVGYLFGYVDLPNYLPFIGDTQFKVLCIIACVIMLGTLTISCLSISERDPRLDGELEPQKGGVFAFFRDLFHSMKKLPDQIKRVCAVQFFAWIGWFPFLFYITTYVGEIFVESLLAENPNMSEEERADAWEYATRIGTFSLLIFAITTFASSVFLPVFVAASYQPPEPEPTTPRTPGGKLKTPHTPMTPGTPGMALGGGYFTPKTPKTPKTPHTPGAAGAGGYFAFTPHPEDNTSNDSPSKSNMLQRWFSRLPSPEISWLTLRRTWLISHVIFFVLTWATLFVKDTTGATILVALIGIPWSVTNWAPYALIAAEISKRENIRRGLIRPPPTRDGELLASGEDPSDGSDQAGVVLGIHNVAIAAPQVIATLVSSAIFAFLQQPRGSNARDDSVGWVLRFGGLAALVAAWFARQVHEEEEEQ